MSASDVRHNLPADMCGLVGRERDVVELVDVLRGSRLVTLSGIGGIGKTRLAQRVAAELAKPRDFADGVWLVPLADLHDPALLDEVLAAAIGVVEEPARPLRDTLIDALRCRESLIVLDNCEHLVAACARLAETLLRTGPRLRILATSREPLAIVGEVVWRVAPLTPPPPGVDDAGTVAARPAVRLFTERAAAARRGFAVTPNNAATVAAITRALDGLPLALELAAARVAVLTVEQIAERLDDRFALLTQGSRTAPARQRTLRATMDWSFELLTDDERVLLRRLAIFAGGWTMDMAADVCGDGDDVLELVSGLLTKSLVVLDGTVGATARYRLLETIRVYAVERLTEAGEHIDVARRHLRHMLELAGRHQDTGWLNPAVTWADRQAAYRRVESELDNHRAALAWALGHDEIDTGLRLCVALRWFWFVRGHIAEGRSWLNRFLCRADRGGRAVAAALIAHGDLAFEQGALDQAAGLAEESRAAFEADGDKSGIVQARSLLARIDIRHGRAARARTALEEIRTLSQAAGDSWTEAAAVGWLGTVASRTGQFRHAARCYEESLAIFQRIGHLGMAANILMGLGLVAHAQGDHDRALRTYTKAHAILSDMDARPQLARCLAGMAMVSLDLGDLALADRRLTESLALNLATGQRLGLARLLDAFADLAAKSDSPARAIRLAGAAAALRAAAGIPTDTSSAKGQTRLTKARATLGAPTATQLWTEGATMPLDSAIAYALNHPGPPPHDPPPANTISGPTTISPREREIAALIARGLTNRQIAAELVISTGTVGRHVSNILTKLGYSSRTQIAMWITHATNHS
ncbi:MAG TPA: LuxR C-terminal-related transcriptional regulator [Actinophytocola sp.]|uniref:LuxR C-terminal-related transcriptional regulator n=1 Tax=Actinophytocola sp. TaxID=1872138 RepID=UPI002DBDA6C4|nr:LuxR C-terminal-related transcriptional regulator [Actinophytocola sp.]HEU5474666.1 LuxR C-terminal-related transcriptional regulator [Actinophytocola sp.]